ARILEKKLLDFGVEGKVTEIHPGPLITMYEFEPAPGIKLSRIANLVDDLCLAMGGRSVRIVAPLPNKPAVGIEIPNNTRETVWLKDIIADEKFHGNESKLVMALGKDIEGIPFVADLAKMPHLLVAGATGSGKSVSINSMILSILYKAKPEEVRIIMVDPKMLELSIYEGIPHLLLPVVTEPKKASLALRWAVREMERRYKLLSDIDARNISNYNKKIEKGNFVSKQPLAQIVEGEEAPEPIKHEGKIPYIVIIVDELADLMMVSSREVEESITRLAQMARAAGIHLILATQRPSVDVLTGVIKANFPARISFKVASKFDARTILDTIGSERLLGNGDMLFVPPGASRMLRVHGAFISETEVARVVEFLKNQAKPIYDETILKVAEVEAAELEADGGESDELYDQAVAIVAETRQASISMIQRKLRVGYNRAARMIEKMEIEGIVSAPTGAGSRQVLVSSFQNPSS
ncbi:MAG: DNA translocase FtsK, partial [Deltaproteobacteria bacterium]|nr:DNA translocase FtsK [Deltaproteobacteria bacterium]